jgi:hypothetical protein
VHRGLIDVLVVDETSGISVFVLIHKRTP